MTIFPRFDGTISQNEYFRGLDTQIIIIIKGGAARIVLVFGAHQVVATSFDGTSFDCTSVDSISFNNLVTASPTNRSRDGLRVMGSLFNRFDDVVGVLNVVGSIGIFDLRR